MMGSVAPKNPRAFRLSVEIRQALP